MLRRPLATGILLFSTVLSGCSGTSGVNSLDGLTTSTTNDGAYARPVNLDYPLQTRFLSVNGQLPVPGAGSACLASSYRVANSIICFSGDGKTKVLRREYDLDADTRLADIAGQLDALKLQVLELELAQGRASTADPAAAADATRAVTAAAATVRSTAGTLTDQMNKANVFLFRWASSRKGGADGSAGSFASAAAAGASGASGLVIVGGLRVSQLLIGSPDNFDRVTKGYTPKAKIATLVLEARQILYVADASASAAVQAAMKGSIDAAKSAKISTAELTARAYAAVASAQDNRGFFKAPDRIVPDDSLGPALFRTKADRWNVFYATMTEIKSLKSAIAP